MSLFGPKPDTRVKRGESVEWSLVEKKAVLVNIEDGVVLKLDDVGTAVWLAIDGKKTMSEIARIICELYEVDERTVRGDLMRLIRNLRSSEAVEYVNEGGGSKWNFFRNVSKNLKK